MKEENILATIKIDRLKLITYKGQKKKVLRPICNRYLAKSHIVKCKANNVEFVYANFRGSIFNKVKFENCKIKGCDFWGTTFNNCDFSRTEISNCIFMACKFTNCNFSNTNINNCVIVNTSLAACRILDSLDKTTQVYNTYPKAIMTEELKSVLNQLNDKNSYLRRYKLLHISDKKYNELNLFLLQQHFSIQDLLILLTELQKHPTKRITTYKKLEIQLKKIKKDITI